MKIIKKLFSVFICSVLFITSFTIAFGAENRLNIKVTSNFFDCARIVVNPATQRINLTFGFQSNFKLLDCEWVLTYDNAKLSLDTSKLSKAMPNCPGSSVMQVRENKAAGAFTSVNMADFTTEKDFINLSFTPVGSGDTDLELKVMVLGLGYKNGGQPVPGYLVDSGEVQDLSSKEGFTNLSYSAGASLGMENGVILGDVNADAILSIEDATLLQCALAGFITLSEAEAHNADINGDGKVSIDDVTDIQTCIAGY